MEILTKPTQYWIAFVAVQAVGYILPTFSNVHSNLVPLLVGFMLLIPGSLAAFSFSEGTSGVLAVAIISSINALIWWSLSITLKRRKN